MRRRERCRQKDTGTVMDMGTRMTRAVDMVMITTMAMDTMITDMGTVTTTIMVIRIHMIKVGTVMGIITSASKGRKEWRRQSIG